LGEEGPRGDEDRARGGNVSDAEVVAVRGGAIGESLDGVQGIEGKTVIDATNLLGVSPPRGLLVERRIREVEDERSDGEVFQRQLRCAALRLDWRSGLDPEQLVVWPMRRHERLSSN
jgi:hypothetical protein